MHKKEKEKKNEKENEKENENENEKESSSIAAVGISEPVANVEEAAAAAKVFFEKVKNERCRGPNTCPKHCFRMLGALTLHRYLIDFRR